MTCYQLSCGHWMTDIPGYRIGDVLGCYKCDTHRTVVIGFTLPGGWKLAP
jgi:hypothetical protein